MKTKQQYIIPIFVPHLGCPNDCTFCNQKSISGQTKKVTAKEVKETIEEYLKSFKEEDSYREVAFFGGSFTGIETKKQEELLKAAYEYVEKKQYNETVLSTASKLNIFFFTDWEKLIYIDADVLVLKNMDELFSYRDCSMVKYDNDEMGFTGLFVIEPSHHYSQFYLTLIENELCFDGDLFGHLWMPFVSYNKEYQIPEYYLGYPWQYGGIKAIHFCNNPKPWHQDYDFSSVDERITKKYKTILDYVRKYQ